MPRERPTHPSEVKATPAIWHNGLLYSYVADPLTAVGVSIRASSPCHRITPHACTLAPCPCAAFPTRRGPGTHPNQETGDTTNVAVKIRLKRMGKIRSPFYRVVIMDSRTKRDGRAIEEIGLYHPTREPSVIQIDSERAQYWLGVGAQPTEQVAALLKVTGDWQKHKGLPGAEGTLKVAEAKPSKKDLYEAAMAAAGKADEDFEKNGATTARKKAAKEQKEEAEVVAANSEPTPEPAPVETPKSLEVADEAEDAEAAAAADGELKAEA